MHERRFHLRLLSLLPPHRWNNNTSHFYLTHAECGGPTEVQQCFSETTHIVMRYCYKYIVDCSEWLIHVSLQCLKTFEGKRPSNSRSCVTCQTGKRIDAHTWRQIQGRAGGIGSSSVVLLQEPIMIRGNCLFHSHPDGSVCRCSSQK